MTSKLWGSRIRRETSGPGKVHTVERYATRPWPADPKLYPLNDSKHGPVYVPPADCPAYPLWVRFIGWMLGGAGLGACIICAFAFVRLLLG